MNSLPYSFIEKPLHLRVLQFGFVFFLFMMFFSPSTKVANIVYYVFVVLPFICSLHHIFKTPSLLVPTYSVIGLILFWASFSLLTQGGVDIEFFSKGFRRAFYLVVFVSVIYFLISRQAISVKQLIELVFFLILVLSVVNIFLQYVVEGEPFGTRLDSFFRFDNPLNVSNMLVVYLFAYMGLHINNDRIFSVLLLFLLVLIMLFLYASRASYVALIGTAILLFIFSNINKKLVVILVFSLILMMLYVSYESGYLLKRGSSYRLEIWLETLAKVRDCGVFLGCGFGDSMHVDIGHRRIFNHPHSIYFSHLKNTGLIGLMTLMALLAFLIVKGIREHAKTVWALVAASLVMIFDGQDIINHPDEWWLVFWLPVTVVLWEIHNNKIENT